MTYLLLVVSAARPQNVAGFSRDWPILRVPGVQISLQFNKRNLFVTFVEVKYQIMAMNCGNYKLR
jgi:hypothetical protein